MVLSSRSRVLFALAVVAALAAAGLAFGLRSRTVHGSGASERVAFLGDSYTLGYGASTVADRWTALVSAHFGWTELNFGVGGTGYVNPPNHPTSYPDRVPAIAAQLPDMVVVSGGFNDRGVARRDPDQELAAIRKTFQSLHEALPSAAIYAVEPFSPAGPPDPELGPIGAAVAQEVRHVGGTYLEIGDPLRNLAQDMSPDRLHPDDAGYQVLAAAVERAYAAAQH